MIDLGPKEQAEQECRRPQGDQIVDVDDLWLADQPGAKHQAGQRKTQIVGHPAQPRLIVTGIERNPVDTNPCHHFVLRWANLVAGVQFAARVVGKAREHLHGMPAASQFFGKRDSLEKGFRLKPLGEEMRMRRLQLALRQTTRFT